MNGGDGNDYLQGDAGADTIDGGNGVDWVTYRYATAAVDVRLDGVASTGGDAAGDVITP